MIFHIGDRVQHLDGRKGIIKDRNLIPARCRYRVQWDIPTGHVKHTWISEDFLIFDNS